LSQEDRFHTIPLFLFLFKKFLPSPSGVVNRTGQQDIGSKHTAKQGSKQETIEGPFGLVSHIKPIFASVTDRLDLGLGLVCVGIG
jgi:hypothetical protein